MSNSGGFIFNLRHYLYIFTFLYKMAHFFLSPGIPVCEERLLSSVSAEELRLASWHKVVTQLLYMGCNW